MSPHLAAWSTTVTPTHLWLRMIAIADRSKAESLRSTLAHQGSFFDLARANSIDQKSARDGGFLGDLTSAQLDSTWASQALKLDPGELSSVIDWHGAYVILQRMPRNFRENAEAVYNRAMILRTNGQRQQSAAQLLEALKIYPRLLRALTYLGVTYGEAGNPQTGAGILSIATRLYPRDAGAHFNLGVALGAMQNPSDIDEYKRALEIDPDLTTAYLNLGASLYSKGEVQKAIDAYRRGIQANPLIASLHYSLAVALDQQGNPTESRKEFALASKIDPNVGHPQPR